MKNKMPHLPNEMIIQILLRLPVKSLLRFKCVSKTWLSLISDPHFAASHFELAAAPSYRLLYLATTDYASQTRSIDINASLLTHSASATLNLSFLPPDSCFDIMGSCRGFLLLSDSFDLYLWNPSTGVHKPLSFSPFTSNLDASFFPYLYGFGYDPSTDDYLIVLACYGPAPDADYETYFELFSLRANAWNKIEGTHLPYSNDYEESRAGTLLNGVIHWLVFRYDVSVDVILAFDLMERSFSEVPLPDDFHQACKFSDLCELGGFLCLCVRNGGATGIWVMKQYKVQSSWTKSIVVSMDGLRTKYFSSVCSSKSGDIVGMDGSTGLVKYDAKGQLLEHRSYCDDRQGCEAAMYIESLFSLPLDGGQAAEGNDGNKDYCIWRITKMLNNGVIIEAMANKILIPPEKDKKLVLVINFLLC